MLARIKKLEKQYGGSIPFSAMEDKKSKTKKKSPIKKSPKKKSSREHKKRSISPSRVHRKATKKLKRSKKQTKKQRDKKCKCGSHTFTGKEETPRGLGKCDECIPQNVVMKGKNGKLYENRKEGWYKLN